MRILISILFFIYFNFLFFSFLAEGAWELPYTRYQTVIKNSNDYEHIWKDGWNPGGVAKIWNAADEIKEKYSVIWKALFMQKNKVSEEYFKKHIELLDVGISTDQSLGLADGRAKEEVKERGREYFNILYKIKVEWVEIVVVDSFMIKTENRDELLTQPQIENEVFNERIVIDKVSGADISPAPAIANFVPVEKLALSFREAVVKLKEVSLPDSKFLEPRFFTLDRRSGTPIIFGFGCVDQRKNIGIECRFDLLNGKGVVEPEVCRKN